MENEKEVIEIVEVNAQQLFQQEKALIDQQVATAKAFPRNLLRSVENAIAIVTMDKQTAEICNYALPRGGKILTGPSVHLAKILAQCLGNMRAETRVVDIGPKQITSQSVAWDLETNLAIKVEVKRSIMTKQGRMNDDMITVTGNAANAIALRNAIFNVIPRSVVNKVYDSAIRMITGDLSDEEKLIAKRKQVIEALTNTYSVTEEQVLASIGKAAIKHITAQDIATLIGIGQAIKDGDLDKEEAFKPIKQNNRKTANEQQSEKEAERVNELIKNADSVEKLIAYKPEIKNGDQQNLFDQKLEELTKPQKKK